MNKNGLVGRPGGEVFDDLLMNRGEAIQTPMDVADGVNALASREGRRGGDEIDH